MLTALGTSCRCRSPACLLLLVYVEHYDVNALFSLLKGACVVSGTVCVATRATTIRSSLSGSPSSCWKSKLISSSEWGMMAFFRIRFFNLCGSPRLEMELLYPSPLGRP